MKTNRAAWLAIPVALLFSIIPAAAQAPDPDPAQGPTPAQTPVGNQNDPGVARVSFIHGDVTMQRGDSGDFSAVTLNMPLMTGDKVATGEGSRTELQLDYANMLRLDRDSEANIATLDKNRIQVQVSQGLASYSMLKGSQADVEIDTPNVSVHPTRAGNYRVQVDPDGDTLVTVNEGEAQVSSSLPFEEQGLTRSTRSATPRMVTISISGIQIATTSFTTQMPTRTPIDTTPVPRTSMRMVLGPKFPITVRFGFLKSTLVGHPTAPAAGFGSPIGAGLGFPMSLGAGRLITMAVGSPGADRGPGGLVRYIPLISRFGRPRTSPSSDSAEA
jgi:hypothetical protein